MWDNNRCVCVSVCCRFADYLPGVDLRFDNPVKHGASSLLLLLDVALSRVPLVSYHLQVRINSSNLGDAGRLIVTHTQHARTQTYTELTRRECAVAAPAQLFQLCSTYSNTLKCMPACVCLMRLTLPPSLLHLTLPDCRSSLRMAHCTCAFCGATTEVLARGCIVHSTGPSSCQCRTTAPCLCCCCWVSSLCESQGLCVNVRLRV